MARNARTPKSDLSDLQLDDIAQMMNELVDERVGAGATFAEQSAATKTLAEELLRRVARRRRAEVGTGTSSD